MPETQSSNSVSTKLTRIAQTAQRYPGQALTALAHSIDIEWLQAAVRRTRKDGATGTDRVTAAQYAERLEENLCSLLQRAKSGKYRAPPVRRVHIPKANGKETRPIGIPTYEDKVLQRAVAMVLEAVYEQDFLDCSFGFRPRRSAHQAVERLQNDTMRLAGGWVVEIDIRRFFDTLDHSQLMDVVRKRVRDGVLLQLLGKWLKAGVLESGRLTLPEAGTPQGGVISPVLANVFLHEVLDLWFERDVKPRLRGRALLVRYADDAVMVFQQERDARRVLEVLPKRFGKFGLTLHPDKTRLVDFRRPTRTTRTPVRVRRESRPGTFDFLGFTHFWSLSRNRKWFVCRKTAKDRFTRAANAIRRWCRRSLHHPIGDQCDALRRKLLGHYAYYGITGNHAALTRFYHQVRRIWRRWLSRRSRAPMTWERMSLILERYDLPKPRIVHTYMRSKTVT